MSSVPDAGPPVNSEGWEDDGSQAELDAEAEAAYRERAGVDVLGAPQYVRAMTAIERALAPGNKPQELCGDLCFAGTLGAIAGPTSVGKTYFTVQFAAAVAGGHEFLGRKGAGVPVLYLNADLPPAVFDERLRACILPACPDPWTAGEKLMVHDIAGFNLLNEANRDWLADRVEAYGTRLLIVDTDTRLHNAKENAAEEVAQVVNALDVIAKRTGAAVWFVHHTRKQDKHAGSWKLTLDDIRGSGVFTAHVATVLVLSQNSADKNELWVDVKNSVRPLAPFGLVRRSDALFTLADTCDWCPDAVRSQLDKMQGQFSEGEVAAVLAEVFDLPPDAARQRLLRLRASGELSPWVGKAGSRVRYTCPAAPAPAAPTP